MVDEPENAQDIYAEILFLEDMVLEHVEQIQAEIDAVERQGAIWELNLDDQLARDNREGDVLNDILNMEAEMNENS